MALFRSRAELGSPRSPRRRSQASERSPPATRRLPSAAPGPVRRRPSKGPPFMPCPWRQLSPGPARAACHPAPGGERPRGWGAGSHTGPPPREVKPLRAAPGFHGWESARGQWKPEASRLEILGFWKLPAGGASRKEVRLITVCALSAPLAALKRW